MKHAVALACLLWGCGDGATVSFRLANQTSVAHETVSGNGTSLRLKMIAAYLAEDVDPQTMDNIGESQMIWIDPQCAGDIDGCNVDGFAQPAGGPRVTEYFDLARPSDEVNADLNSEGLVVTPGTYRYARVEMCKALGATQATVPTLMWKGSDMTAEQPFTSGDCGRTSLAFDPPLVIAAGDAVAVTLGYDLDKSVVSGMPGSGGYSLAGSTQQFRTCIDVDAGHRDCMDFPDFAPTAARQ